MNDEQQDRASLYALGLLSPSETSAFEREMGGDRELTLVVAELRAAVDAFARSIPQHAPRDDLKRQILQRVQADLPRKNSRTATSWLAWAAVILLLAACAALLVDRSHLRQRIETLEQSNALARVEILTLNSLLDQAPHAHAVVVWDVQKQDGLLKLDNLPPTRPDQSYQLWLVDPAYGTPVDAGVFETNSDGHGEIRFHPKKPVREVSKIAVSLERKGGVEKAQGPMVLISN